MVVGRDNVPRNRRGSPIPHHSQRGYNNNNNNLNFGTEYYTNHGNKLWSNKDLDLIEGQSEYFVL